MRYNDKTKREFARFLSLQTCGNKVHLATLDFPLSKDMRIRSFKPTLRRVTKSRNFTYYSMHVHQENFIFSHDKTHDQGQEFDLLFNPRASGKLHFRIASKSCWRLF